MSISYFTFSKMSKDEQVSYLAKLRSRESNLLERIVLLRLEADAVRAELHALAPPQATPLVHDPSLDGVRVQHLPAKGARRKPVCQIVLRPINSSGG